MTASPFQGLRLAALPLIVVASLLGCSSAQAATVTVGSPLTATFEPGNIGTMGILGITSVLGEPGAHAASPVDGAVIGWKLLGEGGPFELRVVRPEEAGTFRFGAISAPQTIASYGLATFTTDLPIKAGEVVGIQAAANSKFGTAIGDAPGSTAGVWVTPPESVATAPEREAADSELSFNATVLPAPTIVSVGPTGGPLAGGTSVTVTGTDFADVQGVSFGSVPAAAYGVASDGQITAFAPPSTIAGAVPISVTTEAGTASSAQQFTYSAPTPPSPPATPAAVAHCVVPKLKGKNFKAAKKRIKAADCQLGKVTKKGVVGRSVKVVKQKPQAGTVRAPGSKINVVLGGK
jgi:hypothetical protein